MENGFDVDFNFNEAFSLKINCKDQKEIDYFWDRLYAVPEAEQCGWGKGSIRPFMANCSEQYE